MRITRIKTLLPAPKDAVRRYLVVSPDKLHLDGEGNWTDGNTVNVAVWMQNGENEEPTQQDIGDFSVHVLKNGSEVMAIKKNEVSFSFQASKDDTSYDVKLKVGDSFVHAVTVSLVSDGVPGVDGDMPDTYVIVPSVSKIDADSEGNILTGYISVQAYRYRDGVRSANLVGMAVLPNFDYYYVQYRIDGDTWQNCSQIAIGGSESGPGTIYLQAYGVSRAVVASIRKSIEFRLLYSANPDNVLAQTPALTVTKYGEQGPQGENGENSIRIDLDNESDAVLYDGNGNRVSSAVTSQARLYDGAEVVSEGVTWAIDLNQTTGCSVNNSGNATSNSYTGKYSCWITPAGKITVNGVNADARVMVKATYNGKDYLALLSIKRLVNVDKYDLLIEPNAISYNSSEDFRADTIAIHAYKTTVEGVREEVTLNSSPVYLAYRLDSESSWHQASASFSTTESMVKGYNNILFELRRKKDGVTYAINSPSSYDVVDYETIPINKVKNGEQGGQGGTGPTGPTGPEGNGIQAIVAYYLATTMAKGVTMNTDPGKWTAAYQQATPEKPYVWKYEMTVYTKKSPTYSTPELIFSYTSGANQNLLEQTNFSSLQAMDKWLDRAAYRRQDSYVGYIGDATNSGIGIATGLQAHNAYHDLTAYGQDAIQWKEVFRQAITGKLEPATWYTLSFYARIIKDDSEEDTVKPLRTFIYPSCIDTAVAGFVDGEEYSFSADGLVQWAAHEEWKRHTVTFKTRQSIGTASQSILFRLMPAETSGLVHGVYICMPKLEAGLQATSYVTNEAFIHQGQLRRRRWTASTLYLAGGTDESYEDVVLVDERGFYRCIKSHVSSDANKPGQTESTAWQEYWSDAGTGQFEMLATELFFAEKALINNLIATLIQTGYDGTPHIEAEGSQFRIYGRGQYPAIFLAVNDANQAVLRFQDENTGEFLYDLGPEGIMRNFSEVADTYTEISLHKLTDVRRVSELLNITASLCTKYYRFNEGYKQIGSGTSATKQYHVSGTEVPSAKNSCYFTSKSYNGALIPDGWYCKPNNGVYMMMMEDSGATSVYGVTIYRFANGKLVESVTVYFTTTDRTAAMKSVGCDELGNELSTSAYPYLYSYSRQQQ